MLRVLCGFAIVSAAQANIYWGYKEVAGQTIYNCGQYANDTCGPSNWRGLEEANSCGNLGDQSPILANTTNATTYGGNAISGLKFTSPGTGIESTLNTCGAGGLMTVGAHTWSMYIPANCQSQHTLGWTIPNGTQVVYNLVKYDFHAPSEHTLNGRYFDMEVQLVHQNPANNAEQLIVAVFLQSDAGLKAKCVANQQKHAHCIRANFLSTVLLGGMTEAALVTAVDGLNDPAAKFEKTATVAIDPYKGFLPPVGTHYYFYNGSLTAPPCTATQVQWILHPVHVLIYPETLALFKRIIAALKIEVGGVMVANPSLTAAGGNNRPQQSLGLRKLNAVGQVGTATLVTAALKAATSLDVADIAGFTIGETIVIGAGTTSQEVNVVKAFGTITGYAGSVGNGIVLTTALQFAHSAGTKVQSTSTTTPGITVTPAPGAITTTPAGTVTPIAPLRRYSEQKAAENKSGVSNMVFLGVGCLVGMAVLLVVQGLRSRREAASTRSMNNFSDAEDLETDTTLLSSTVME
jgi:carbonic anhydrase